MYIFSLGNVPLTTVIVDCLCIFSLGNIPIVDCLCIFPQEVVFNRLFILFQFGAMVRGRVLVLVVLLLVGTIVTVLVYQLTDSSQSRTRLLPSYTRKVRCITFGVSKFGFSSGL